MPWLRSTLLLLSCVLALAANAAAANEPALPDWSASTFDCPASVRERDVFTCTLTIRRGEVDRIQGPADAAWTVSLPPQGLFVGAEAEGGAAFDPERRVVQAQAPVEPGAVHAVRLRLIAAPDTDGSRLSVRVAIDGAEPTYFSTSTEVQPRRRASETGAPGSVVVTSAGVWVFGFMLTGPVFIGGCALLGGRRASVLALATAAWFAMGFLLVFAAMAREDLRLFTDYREAACVVTDTGAHTRVSGQGRHATNMSQPFVAVRFEVAGHAHFGTGFDSGSHLRSGGSTWSGGEAAAFGPGATVRCWYDPDDPARVVVVRGPGGTYLFALLPLGLLLLVARPLWRAVAQRGRG